MSEFVIVGIDDWDDQYERGVAVSKTVHVRQAVGVTYWLRLIEGTWVFCPAHTHEPDALYYLTNALPEEEWIEQAAFEAAMVAGEFGRFIVYTVGRRSTFHLWLSPEGTGRALEWDKMHDFVWQYREGRYDVRALSGKSLDEFVEHVFSNFVNPILDDPFILDRSKELVEVPIEFICGSEEELRKLSTWIIQSEPRLFNSSRHFTNCEVRLCYSSFAPDGSPYLNTDGQAHTSRSGPYPGIIVRYPHVVRLAELVFEHNAFTGMYWEYQDINANRRSGWEERPLMVNVAVKPPRPSETKRAKENLRSWLEGKVPAAEIAELLGSVELE